MFRSVVVLVLVADERRASSTEEEGGIMIGTPRTELMLQIIFAVSLPPGIKRSGGGEEESSKEEEETWEGRVGGLELRVKLPTGGGDFIGSIGFIREPLSWEPLCEKRADTGTSRQTRVDTSRHEYLRHDC